MTGAHGVSGRHLVRRAGDARFAAPAWAGDGGGFFRWSIVDESGPAVHTGFGICACEPGGATPSHVHSYEESFYLLEGEAILQTPEGGYLLRPGDYGFVPVGAPHAWRNAGDAPARWADMLAPQPRGRHGDDTQVVAALPPTEPAPVDVRDPRTRWFGHIEPANMDPGKQSQDLLALSASMRTALLVYSGITVKMMVDTDLGAQLETMFMVQYDREGRGRPRTTTRSKRPTTSSRARRWPPSMASSMNSGRATPRSPGSAACTASQRRPGAAALAGDPGPAAARPLLLPLRPRLGLPGGPSAMSAATRSVIGAAAGLTQHFECANAGSARRGGKTAGNGAQRSDQEDR